MDYKEITCWVGVDWADRKHAFAVRKVGSEKMKVGSFLQKVGAIDEWVNSLRKLSDGGKVAVALEQAKGGLLFALMKYDFIVLFPVIQIHLQNSGRPGHRAALRMIQRMRCCYSI